MPDIRPISLHPDNPRYFLYDGRQTVLVGSCEHYGAVMNRDFDYEKYLCELARRGLNHDRVFPGIYREIEGESFDVQGCILAPTGDTYVCPWPRSDRPGSVDGGNLFDLDAWNEAYFERLHGYMDKALELGIVVEFVLFCPYYHLYFGEDLWRLSPLHPLNNVNHTEDAPAQAVLSLNNPVILSYCEKLVVRLLRELNRYPNLIVEVCNEPWNDDVLMDWHAHIADLILRTEQGLPSRHLVSMDVACGHFAIGAPKPGISVYNFHYVLGQTAEDNHGLGLPIGQNETGFWGHADATYRKQGWEFMLSGGALYNNLDYSFTMGHEDGTFQYWEKQPGGGSAALRAQLGWMRAFLDGQPLTRMRPDRAPLLKLFANSPRIFMLSGDSACCAYILSDSPSALELRMPAGEYRLTSLDPLSGQTTQSVVRHADAATPLHITLPAPSGDEMAFGLARISI